MVYRSHIAFSGAIAMAPAAIPALAQFYPTEPTEVALLYGLIFVSSLAPDFDEPHSYLSSKFPWLTISLLLSALTKHRGVTHRIIAVPVYGVTIFAILSSIGIKNSGFLAACGALSYLVHLIGDGMTVGGIKHFWWPISKKTFWSIPRPLRFKIKIIDGTLAPSLKETAVASVSWMVFAAESWLYLSYVTKNTI